MNIENIISQFNPELDDNNLEIIKLFNRLETKEEYQTEAVSHIDKLLLKNFNILKDKLEKCSIKVNTALFGDKKFINESYAYEIPIQKEYFENNENVKFEDNILTNTNIKSSKDKRINLSINNITSRKNTSFKFINKTLYIEKNELHNYQEIQLHIPKNIISGLLHIQFSKYDNITLLNKFGRELVPKTITNFITHPISKNTESLVIRFNSNEKKSLNITDFYVSESSYSLESVVYTKPIGLFEELQEIAINTCDNYSDENSDINYEMSINKGPYRTIRPLNKQKNLHLNSILSVDDTLSYYKLENSIYWDDLNLYTTDHFDSQAINILKSFSYKLGDDLGLIVSEEIFIYLEEDLELKFNKNDIFSINDIEYDIKDESKNILLKKGFNKLRLPASLWNQTINMLQYEVIEIGPKITTLRLKEDGSIVNRLLDFDTKTNNSIFLQLIQKAKIFVEEVTLKTYFANSVLYITKNTNKDAHTFIKYKTNYVETVQLKITLKSLSKTSPVYLSSLTIRGI